MDFQLLLFKAFLNIYLQQNNHNSHIHLNYKIFYFKSIYIKFFYIILIFIENI